MHALCQVGTLNKYGSRSSSHCHSLHAFIKCGVLAPCTWGERSLETDPVIKRKSCKAGKPYMYKPIICIPWHYKVNCLRQILRARVIQKNHYDHGGCWEFSVKLSFECIVIGTESPLPYLDPRIWKVQPHLWTPLGWGKGPGLEVGQTWLWMNRGSHTY